MSIGDNRRYEYVANRLISLIGVKQEIKGKDAKIVDFTEDNISIVRYLFDGKSSSRIQVMYEGGVVLDARLNGYELEEGAWQGILEEKLILAEESHSDDRRREELGEKATRKRMVDSSDPFKHRIRRAAKGDPLL